MNQDNRPPRRKLKDILDGKLDDLRKAWANTKPAADFAPLPAGQYVAHLHNLELFNSRHRRTPGAKLTFRVAEGEHAGRHLWLDTWLTDAATPHTLRDLAKLGISAPEQLDEMDVTPGRIRCRVRVALRCDDHGAAHNDVRDFTVLGLDEPEGDNPFAPAGGDGEGAGDGDGADDTDFPFGHAAPPTDAGAAEGGAA